MARAHGGRRAAGPQRCKRGKRIKRMEGEGKLKAESRKQKRALRSLRTALFQRSELCFPSGGRRDRQTASMVGAAGGALHDSLHGSRLGGAPHQLT